MNLKDLSKTELLKVKQEVEDQLKIVDIKKAFVKQSKEKNLLSDLEKDDQILCIIFKGSIIYDIDYVKINFHKGEEKNTKWTNFSVKHDVKPMGCSAALKDECMNYHFFLVDFSSSMRFFTLKPQTWKHDLKIEMDTLIKSRTEVFNKDMNRIKKEVNDLIKNKEADSLINDLLYKAKDR